MQLLLEQAIKRSAGIVCVAGRGVFSTTRWAGAAGAWESRATVTIGEKNSQVLA